MVSDSRARTSETDSLAFLAGGGEMGRLIRAKDWSKTPIGPPETWPQSLRMTVSLCLASNFPINILWGPGCVQIYNDGYRDCCGDAHPQALGEDFRVTWASALPVIGESFERALAGETMYLRDRQVFLRRRGGALEETFFTLSHSPIRDESGGVGGLFHPVTETTATMLAERRTRALRDLAARNSEAKSVQEALTLSAQTLSAYDLDLPFVLLYALDPDGRQARLAAATGLAAGGPASPETLTVGPTDHVRRGSPDPAVWPLEEVVRSRAPVQVDGVGPRLGPPPYGPYPEPPNTALVLPILPPGADRPAALLIAGVSSRLPLTEAYRSFYQLLAAGVTTAVANARAYEEERQRAEALAELDRAKTAFFSNVSHEFRTPLTLILGPVEDLLDKGYPEVAPTAKGQLEVVHRNSLRLLKLVNTMLDFSRIEAGRLRASYEPTDLAAYTAELASVFRAAVERAGLRLVVDCPPLPEPAFVDRDMWEKVVLNLLSNAFKFTLEGEIEVRLEAACEPGASATGEFARLTVRDTGVGIPAEEMPRIFERFHRVPESRGRTHEGTGIGLALVQELVRLHGGTVSAESVLNRGSRFVVTIPLGKDHLDPTRIGTPSGLAPPTAGADAFVQEALRWLPAEDDKVTRWQGDRVTEAKDSPPKGASEPASVTLSPARPRIVWADDNADMREYVTRLLGGRFAVTAVADGQAALEAVRADPPDLVLTDVMMPRLDGVGLLRTLRTDPRLREVPVILLSARAGQEARVEGLEQGADDYLIKPFPARELIARIEAQVRLRQLRREATEAIRASEERFRALVLATSCSVYRMSPDWSEMRQLDGRGFISNTLNPTSAWLEKYIHADDQAQVLKRIQEAVRTKSLFELEHRVRRPDGTLGWTLSRAVPLVDDKGEIREWFGAASDVTDRRRTEDALREREAWLAGQKQALQAALSGAPLEESLAVLVHSSMEHYGPTTRAAFYLADRDGKTLYHVVGMGPEYAKKCEGFPIGPDSFACGLAIHAGKPILTTDVRQEPLWEQWLWITENFDFRACGSFPLQTSEGKVLGTFAVYWREPHAATPADVAFATTVADTASITVARHLEAEERKRAEQALAAELDAMTRLHGLAERLVSITDLPTALGEVLDAAIALHGADKGTMQFYDPATDTLKYAAWRGFDAKDLAGVANIDRDFHSTCAAALRTGQRVVAADIFSDPQWADHEPSAKALGYRAGISSLMKTRCDELLGVLTVHFREPYTPTDRELRWADVYARLAAHLVERHRSEAALRESRAKLARELEDTRRLQSIGGLLIEDEDGQELAEQILDVAIQIMGAQFGSIQRFDNERGELRLLAWRNFHPESAKYWQSSRVESGTTCGTALGHGQRVIVPDVEADDAFRGTKNLEHWRLCGIAAVQSTPLTTRAGRLIGMISTHWREPHTPDERDLRLLDILARQAADFFERRGAVQALRASEERLRLALKAARMGTWSWEVAADRHRRDANLNRLLGLEPAETVLPVEEFFSHVHPEERDAVRAAFDASVRQGRNLSVDFRVVWPGGEVRWLRDQGDVFAGSAGPHLAGACLDITERKQMEDALREADRRKDEFLAMLGHELRNPLSPLRGVMYTLQHQELDKSQLEHAHAMIDRQVAHLCRLVDDLLDVSRITRGLIELRSEPVNLAELATQAVEMVAPVVEGRGHELSVALPRNPLRVEGDATRLTQVIFNLLNNAAKYTDPGGKVSLTVERADAEAVVRVRDNGTGMAPTLVPKVFELFTQGDRAPDRSQGGLGLGLTLVKRLVEMHGGQVEARSEGPGCGSEFTVRLPALAAEASRTPVQAPSPPLTAAKVDRALVVDDVLDVAETFTWLLAGLAREIKMVHSGPAAVELAREFRPDLILCDIGMPGMDGYETCRRLRQLPGLEKTIIASVSGYGTDADRQKSQASGFDRQRFHAFAGSLYLKAPMPE